MLISKLYTASQKYIHCTFECPNVIQNIPMDIFDFVRVLGILIDNALEAAEESEQKELAVAIYQDKEQMEISIINSCNQAKESINQLTKKGVTTKKGHSGLGLSNIEEINRKTIKGLLSKPHKRSTIIISKIITCIKAGNILLLYVTLTQQ